MSGKLQVLELNKEMLSSKAKGGADRGFDDDVLLPEEARGLLLGVGEDVLHSVGAQLDRHLPLLQLLQRWGPAPADGAWGNLGGLGPEPRRLARGDPR